MRLLDHHLSAEANETLVEEMTDQIVDFNVQLAGVSKLLFIYNFFTIIKKSATIPAKTFSRESFMSGNLRI